MASSVFEGDVFLEVFDLFYGKLLTLNHSFYLNSASKYYFEVKSCDHLRDISICFIRSQRGRVELDFFFFSSSSSHNLIISY